MNKPKLGLSMLYCLEKPFEYMVESISKAGVKYVEIVDDLYHKLDKQRVASLNEVRASSDSEFSVHAPFLNINIASPSNSLLNAMLKKLKKSMRNARELNAYIWIVHSGMRNHVTYSCPDEDWQKNVETLGILLKQADEYGLRLVVENGSEPYPFLLKSIDDFSRFYDDFGESMEMVLDVGHSNIGGQTEQFLTKFGSKIVHMHLSDNYGESDQHFGIGCGSVDWSSFFKKIKKVQYDGVLVVEAIGNIKQSLTSLERYVS